MSDTSKRVPVVVMTSTHFRHKFLVNYLSGHLDVRGVISEKKRPLPTSEKDHERTIIDDHFAERDEYEEKYFGEHTDFRLDSLNVLEIERGTSNTDEVFEWIKEREPEYIILFGTSIIKDPILSAYDKNIINMHLGLSPYYRGSGTNFWPLVDGKPECVGVTVHLAVLDVDAGGILGQARPDIQKGDQPHDIGNKTIIAGAELLARLVPAYKAGSAYAHGQDLSKGSVFKQKDFNADAVVAMRNNFESGMIQEYVDHKSERDARYPIVEISS